jgi:2-methylcitrate dehydratase PrpD
MERIEVDVDVDSQGGGRGRFPMPGIVSVTDRSGRKVESTVEYVKGHPKNPMDLDNVAAKLAECAAYGYPEWRDAGHVAQLVRRLEDCRDVSELVRLCARREIMATESAA